MWACINLQLHHTKTDPASLKVFTLFAGIREDCEVLDRAALRQKKIRSTHVALVHGCLAFLDMRLTMTQGSESAVSALCKVT